VGWIVVHSFSDQLAAAQNRRGARRNKCIVGQFRREARERAVDTRRATLSAYQRT
jgi:hypothetical protein